MSAILNLSELYNSYKCWVNKNPQTTTDFEITAKWLSYFVAGRINSSHVVSELVYCLSNLLVLYNDRIICNLRQINKSKSGERLKLFLTVIEYAEVFLELSAAKVWGEKGRWLIICTIQFFKCISKLLLVYKYEESVVQTPVIPVLERRKLDQNNDEKRLTLDPEGSSLGSVSFKLKQSGRIVRKVEASPPINLRVWKPIQKEIRGHCENEENVEQALIERQIAAETIYLLKPLAHLGSLGYYGNNNWKPYVIALMFDLCSLQLYRSCSNTKYNSLTPKQRFQINRRTVGMLLYLVRSPFYNKYSKGKIINFLNSLSNKMPLASLICTPLIQYLPFWQSNYFYMWSA